MIQPELKELLWDGVLGHVVHHWIMTLMDCQDFAASVLLLCQGQERNILTLDVTVVSASNQPMAITQYL